MKIQSKLRLKQGEKRLGEDISINTIKVGDLVKVKKYGWIMRVDDIKGDLYYLENSKKGFDLSGKYGNPGSYYIDEIQKINNISGTKQATKRTKGSNYHKDTKSHNVNIKVMSGVKAKSLIGEVSNIRKIDVLNFTKAEMTAKLFSISRNWAMLPEKIALNKPRATVWVRNTIRENFIYPKQYEKKTTLNLLLFLLGNENNLFSKAIK